MSSQAEKKCCVCGVPSTTRCSACSQAGVDLYFCSSEHQKLVWFAHKPLCGSLKAGLMDLPGFTPVETRILQLPAFRRTLSKRRARGTSAAPVVQAIGNLERDYHLIPGSFMQNLHRMNECNCRSVLEYLEMTPNVEHLRIRIKAKPSPLHMRNLFQKLSGLPQLFSLEIDGVHPTALESLSALPCSKLTRLVLSGTLSPQLRNLTDVLKVHPVTCLYLRDASTSDWQLPASRPQDLKVQNLSISGRSVAQLHELVDAAPLKNVEACAGSSKDSDRVSPKRLKAFIMKHRSSLLSFKTDRLFFIGSAFVSTVNRILAHEDISVRVVTVG